MVFDAVISLRTFIEQVVKIKKKTVYLCHDTWRNICAGFDRRRASLAGVQWIVTTALKKGADGQKIQDVHDKTKEYDKKSADCEKRFVMIEERKADSKIVDDIRMDISLMRMALTAALSGDAAGTIIQSHSPMSLNEAGKKLAAEMNIDGRIEKNWAKIQLLLNNNTGPKTPYDIQQFCIDTARVYPERFLSDEDIDFLKDYAYDNGKPLAYYGEMIGVIIRDRYFEQEGIK